MPRTLEMDIADQLNPTDAFAPRHLGPDDADIKAMLQTLSVSSLDELMAQTLPDAIRLEEELSICEPASETQALEALRAIASKNKVCRSFIGQGYYGTITPGVIQRNILENPGWYTQYTPYQAEISQGRLEALLNFQTMVADLTGLPMANASLLDEPTAAAEAMAMCYAQARGKKNAFFVADHCHPQTINVIKTRAWSMGIDLHVGDANAIDFDAHAFCGVLVQYPNTFGVIENFDDLTRRAHTAGAMVVAATDLLALTLIRPPGEWADGGADIAVGSAQRFGVPMGFGGPHAAFMACTEKLVRKMPGRIVGVSKDALGNPAYRLAIQTREQHIKRDRATSNICTAQVLLAIMAGMYAVYHGPEGLKKIAQRVHRLTRALALGLQEIDREIVEDVYFDTLVVRLKQPVEVGNHFVEEAAKFPGLNIRLLNHNTVSISLDESTDVCGINLLIEYFNGGKHPDAAVQAAQEEGHKYATRESPLAFRDERRVQLHFDSDAHHAYVGRLFELASICFHGFERESSFLKHPVFNNYHCEHEMLRYIKRLEARDLSLAQSMIPLGSCTMKLNATSQMVPVTWPEFSNLHPYAPADQTLGYQQLFADLEKWLAQITGFAAVSLQPNAGSQGEYAGLLAIRGYHEARGEAHRDVCLIPVSAHGTNPASAVIVGYKVVGVQCDPAGNIDVADLKAKCIEHKDKLAALMITYPSTHGVFEEAVQEICAAVHEHGGQVYMDGANMNAQVGLTSPGRIGADVCHLNLHKTFCIPHGGGGPGMGPIGVAEHLQPYLPGDPLDDDATRDGGIGPVSAAAYGSASILSISWMYIKMMGTAGLKKATQVAILNANYMVKRLEEHYPVLFLGANGRAAHEFIIDARPVRVSAGIEVEDIAKRLMDYGFHAPTMSWPVAGTLMIEPTESESRAELDRLCDALIAIRQEIRAIEEAKASIEDNVLKHALHCAAAIVSDQWTHPYSREQAAFPSDWVRQQKFWPAVARIDNAYGDRHLVCTCDSVEAYSAT